jgi:exopolyphosphatase/pppGpp-phosphohydrolase
MGGQKNEPNYQAVEALIMGRLSRELPDTLFYHGHHHTQDVMNAAMIIAQAEGKTEYEQQLLRIAICFHDSGFIYVYKDHEERGAELARELLPGYGFNQEQIDIICGMIMATKVPQNPQNHLEQIICDADLDYLGGDSVNRIADSLFEELKVYFNLTDPEKWNELQINFLSRHQYHTRFSKENRQPRKEAYLKLLQKDLS